MVPVYSVLSICIQHENKYLLRAFALNAVNCLLDHVVKQKARKSYYKTLPKARKKYFKWPPSPILQQVIQ